VNNCPVFKETFDEFRLVMGLSEANDGGPGNQLSQVVMLLLREAPYIDCKEF